MALLLYKQKPALKYCGLTVILSNLSRFDNVSVDSYGKIRGCLLTANGGTLFNCYCLQPEFNIMQCEVRLADDESALLSDTKCILLLGEYALHKWIPQSRNNTLNELRGTLFKINSIPTIASYFPQDAADAKNYEAQFNEQSKDFGEEDGEGGEDGDEKNHSITKRSNYSFWLKADTRKCKDIINDRLPIILKPTYNIFPSAIDVINTLKETKGKFLYFDIETDYEEQNLLCFSFNFQDSSDVYSIPILDSTYRVAYMNNSRIICALSVAIRDNTLVAHNGAGFDFLVLAMKYRIPIYKCYDTMISMHRCFPDIEKSLGHCTSYWTWEPFHKDTDSRAYTTREHMMTKLQYCAKDVWTMKLIHEAITAYAKTIPGLPESIQCGMDSIVPYLASTLQGIRYSQEKLDKVKNENDRLMTQYLRIISLLIGSSGMEDIRRNATKGGKEGAFPSSNSRCCYYFHELLDYPVVARSPKTGKPSLGKKAMYKLALKFPENPVITFTLLFRQIQKEYSTLKFNPWRDDDNKIIKRTAGSEEISGNRLAQGLLRSLQAC